MAEERLLDKRGIGFCIIIAVYILAGVAGTVIFHSLNYGLWLNLLAADIAATAIVFAFSCIFRNASVYDPYWSVQPVVILWLMVNHSSFSLLRILLLAVITYWGIRLTGNWARTFYGLQHEDWRYVMLRQKTRRLYPVVNFLGIHLFPTLVVYACIVPAVYAFRTDINTNIWSVLFILVSAFAVTLQMNADRQMHEFRKTRPAPFIRTGLWKYSRHPNYLGEILMWWGVALAVVCAAPDHWYLCCGAVINTLMFLFVSIPMADNRQSAKPGFDAYKQSTRMLLPIKRL